MKFSERVGYTQPKTVIQKESMDTELRNSLWNALQMHYWDKASVRQYSGGVYLSDRINAPLETLCQRLTISFFKRPLDTLSEDWMEDLKQIRAFFFKCAWFEVYDFIEFVAQNWPDEYRKANAEFIKTCNLFLERELSAYRFVGNKITSISSDEEISSIEESLKTKYDPVREHVNRSLELFSDRKSPDYRNSIKESISAVEALARVVTKVDKGTLGELLSELDKKSKLHPALKGAFIKLYGYTSDAKGIRHALMDESNVTFEEAKFMLVACSAFINYVTGILK